MAPLVVSDYYDPIIRKIFAVICSSGEAEHPYHSRNILQWVEKLRNDCDECMRIAALGHEIETAVSKEFNPYEVHQDHTMHKIASQLNSANMVRDIMMQVKSPQFMIDDVYYLIKNLSSPMLDERIVVLREADALSFFDVVLPFYYRRNIERNVRERCIWEFRRLTDRTRKYLKNFYFRERNLQKLVEELLIEAE